MAEKFGSAKRSCLLAFTIALTFSLFACGGGGGGDSGSSSGGGSGGSGASTNGIVITSSNAQNVAGVAVTVSGGSTASALTTVVGVETTTARKPRLITRVLEQVAAQASNAAAMPQTVVGAMTTVDCSKGGSVTIDEASDGKSGTLTFNACSEIAGEVLSGSVTVTGLVSSVGSPNFQASFSMNITFTETGSPTVTMAGDFSVTRTCSTTTDCTATFAGSRLSVAAGTTALTLSNFTLSETKTSTSVAPTVHATVSVTSNTINGSPTIVRT